MAEDPVIRVRGLVNRFGSQTVHDGLDLDVMPGEILVRPQAGEEDAA